MAEIHYYTSVRPALTYTEDDDPNAIREILKTLTPGLLDYDITNRTGSIGVFNVERNPTTKELIVTVGEPSAPDTLSMPAAATVWADAQGTVIGTAELLLGYREV